MSNKNKLIYIFVVLFVLAAASVAYFIYQGNYKKTEELSGCEKSGGKMDEGQCECPSLFPIYNESADRCEDRYGQFVSSLKELEVIENRVKFATNCVKNNREVYVIPSTPVTFCYNSADGFPKQEELDNLENAFSVTFVPKGGGMAIEEEPKIYYFKKDSNLAGQKNWPELCYSCADLSLKEEKIASAMGLEGDEEIEKVETENFTALRIVYGGLVIYYLPDAFDNYNLILTIKEDKGEVLDDFIKSVWFDYYAI